MAGWKTKFLNLAGRTTLAKAVLNSIHTHVMQLHKLPSTVTNRIDKIQRNFIWGTTNVKRKLHLISWDVVTEEKEAGGLGLQKSKTKNDIDISPNCLHCGLPESAKHISLVRKYWEHFGILVSIHASNDPHWLVSIKNIKLTLQHNLKWKLVFPFSILAPTEPQP